MTYQITLTAIADPSRRHILESLRDKPRTVSELASLHPVSRPAVSQHLKVLDRAGLVNIKAEGTRRLYSVRREGFGELRNYLDDFWADALMAYAQEVEKHVEQMND